MGTAYNAVSNDFAYFGKICRLIKTLMKIKFDIDVTPQELRTFLGLPNIEPLQTEMLEQIRKNMSAGVEGFDPLSLTKHFMPEQLQTFNTLQKTFWQALFVNKNQDKESKP